MFTEFTYFVGVHCHLGYDLLEQLWFNRFQGLSAGLCYSNFVAVLARKLYPHCQWFFALSRGLLADIHLYIYWFSQSLNSEKSSEYEEFSQLTRRAFSFQAYCCRSKLSSRYFSGFISQIFLQKSCKSHALNCSKFGKASSSQRYCFPLCLVSVTNPIFVCQKHQNSVSFCTHFLDFQSFLHQFIKYFYEWRSRWHSQGAEVASQLWWEL